MAHNPSTSSRITALLSGAIDMSGMNSFCIVPLTQVLIEQEFLLPAQTTLFRKNQQVIWLTQFFNNNLSNSKIRCQAKQQVTQHWRHQKSSPWRPPQQLETIGAPSHQGAVQANASWAGWTLEVGHFIGRPPS